MRVVADSSVWISLLTRANGHENYLPLLAPPVELLVPATIVYEVVRWSFARRGEDAAQAAQEFLERRQVVPIDTDLAVQAAILAHGRKLAMADAIILACANRHRAELWTQDADFDGLERVKFFPKLSRP